MTKILAFVLACAGAIWLGPAPANAASQIDGIKNDCSYTADLSAARKDRRRGRRAVRARGYTYPGPTPYGYYGPTYYERPYARPAPWFFGTGGWW